MTLTIDFGPNDLFFFTSTDTDLERPWEKLCFIFPASNVFFNNVSVALFKRKGRDPNAFIPILF